LRWERRAQPIVRDAGLLDNSFVYRIQRQDPAMTKPFANPLLATPDRPLPRAVAIIGAGTIGPDIGYYLKSAIPGLKLYLVDVNQKAVESALLRFAEYSRKAVARGKMSEAEAKDVIHNLYGTMDYADIADADWVIEAATENLPLKRKIFAQIEAVVRPDALITSNTSSLPAELIFSQMKHPARATVTHFFAPAWRNPAVEVIRMGEDRPRRGRIPALGLLHDRQGAAGHGRRRLLHARPHLRQLVQRIRHAARPRHGRRGRQRRLRIRPCRALLRAEPGARQPHHHRDQHAAGRDGRRALRSRADLQIGRYLGHGAARQKGRSRDRPPRRRSASACWASSSRKAWTSSTARSAIRPTSTSAAAWRWASSRVRST
jgi:hypothetical protein